MKPLFPRAWCSLCLCLLLLLAPERLMAQEAAPTVADTQATEILLTKQALAQLKQTHRGRRWIVLLWSLDCAACIKELTSLETLMNTQVSLPLVLINTDTAPESARERQRLIHELGLQQLQQFYFATDQASQSRYLIDPNWYGELPRSYFIDEGGSWHGKSGLVAQPVLSQWLVPQLAKPAPLQEPAKASLQQT